MDQQLDDQINNMHIGGRNNTPPRSHEVEDIQEHFHHLLALEEEGLQDMIIIGDQNLLGDQGNLQNVLSMVHNIGLVARILTTNLTISLLCNKIHVSNNMWRHI